MSDYTVVVGNIGEVFHGTNCVEGMRVYGEYKRMSISGYGRAAHEGVTLMRGDDTVCEHVGTLMNEES